MAPIIRMDSQVHQPSWMPVDTRQNRGGGGYMPHQQWPAGGQMHIGGPIVLARDIMDDVGFAASTPAGMTGGRPLPRGLPAPMMGRDLNDGNFMGRGYSIKRCQGFVRCDMDIDAEVVGWVIGKNGSTIKDMKHKTGCNMWVDQRALKLTITGPDLAAVEHAAKSVDAYVAAAPIKAGAVEAAVTKTLDCPTQVLDMLGDRTTIARIVKETHAQVVVNKKIGRIIVRGDHRSVDLACASVQSTIQAALHGTLGLRLNTPDSASNNGGPYFSGGGGSSGGTGVGASALGGSGGLSPCDSLGGVLHPAVPSHSPRSPSFGVMDVPDIRSFSGWPTQDGALGHSRHVVHPRHHPQHQLARDGRGSDTDESEIETETVSLGSIGGRTPVSSTAGSPRGAQQTSLTTSPASITASTPGGDWSLFSGGFSLGMAALHEGSSSASTPTTVTAARTTPRVHFPEDIPSLGVAVPDARDGEDGKDIVGGQGIIGSSAPPPSPASTTSAGDVTRRARGALADACALDALEASDDEEGDDIEDKVARLGKRLQAMGLGKYCDKFAENEVDLEALGLMSEGDLADIGIPKGPRLKILNAVGRGTCHSA